MREEVEEANWFARWEEELPTPEELTPLSQTLITPDLALAFDIPTSSSTSSPAAAAAAANHHHHHHRNSISISADPPPPSIPLHHRLPPPPPTLHSPDFDSTDLGSSGANGNGGGGGGSAGNGGADEPARTLKRPRLVWTPQLHKRFVDAVAHLGIKNAVPKTIMQLMSVDGLTRENVASHLQKYRLYLKRMQGAGGGAGVGVGPAGPISAADAATDQLFASGPLPHHFLNRGGGGGGGGGGGPHPAGPEPPPFMPYMPVAALQHHQQMVAAAAAQQQFYHQRQLGAHFGGEHGFLARGAGMGRAGPGLHGIMQQQQQQQVVGPGGGGGGGDVEELEDGGGRRVLTLFPTGED